MVPIAEAGFHAVAVDQRGCSGGARPDRVVDYGLNTLHEKTGRMLMAAVLAAVAGAFLFSSRTAGQATRDDSARAQPLEAPTVVNAIDGILRAFQTHPLVGIGDNHNSAQEEDFYAALVRDPRFSREVGNIVVEFGSAAHQDLLNGYLKGQEVSYADLRRIWTDVVGWIPTVTGVGYANFFAQVRAVNVDLSPERRIHVWLGEPPIDWSKIKTKDEFEPIFAQRDTHAADVIEKNILGPGKKAVVIYGDLHFYNNLGLRRLIEKQYPDAFFIVAMYAGYATKSCTLSFEQSISDWPVPALATPLRGTSLESKLYRRDCDVEPRRSLPFRPSMSEAQKIQFGDAIERMDSGADGDALLFLGKANTLTRTPMEPSIYLDLTYRREIERRQRLVFGESLKSSTVEQNPVSPNFIHPQ